MIQLRLLIVSAFIALAVSLTDCSNRNSAEPATGAGAIPAVAVAKVARTHLSQTLTLTAEFIPFQEIELMAKVSGYVKHVGIDIGDRVRAGQVLATIEVPEMVDDMTKAAASVQLSDAEVVRARDEVERAKAAHAVIHLTYARLVDVSKSKPGLIAQQEIDDAQGKDLVAEAQIAAAQSSLQAAQQGTQVYRAEQSRYSTMYNYTRVIAPFDGVVTARYANQGSMIQSGTASQTQAMPIVKLSQNNFLRLMLPVPESAVPSIKLGELVEVQVPTMHKSFRGKVARFTNRVTTSTRTMETEVDVPNPKLEITPGMYAQVNLQSADRPEALAIPVAAVDTSGSAPFVYKVSGGTIAKTNVKVGLETASSAEILAGLGEGDMVVIGSRASLKPGDKVKPQVVTLPSTDPEP